MRIERGHLLDVANQQDAVADGGVIPRLAFDGGEARDRLLAEAGLRVDSRAVVPISYLNAPRAMQDSSIPDLERAAIVRRLFKQCASGTYTKQEILQKATHRGTDQPPRPTAQLTND